jgi:hypothetical protein
MTVNQPIPYSETIRPEDTIRAMETIIPSLYPNDNKVWAIMFSGVCPRCGDPINAREWLVAVGGSRQVSDNEMKGIAEQINAPGVPSGDETFDLTCSCTTDHRRSPRDKRGCGARFRVRVAWP